MKLRMFSMKVMKKCTTFLCWQVFSHCLCDRWEIMWKRIQWQIGRRYWEACIKPFPKALQIDNHSSHDIKMRYSWLFIDCLRETNIRGAKRSTFLSSVYQSRSNLAGCLWKTREIFFRFILLHRCELISENIAKHDAFSIQWKSTTTAQSSPSHYIISIIISLL